MRWLGEQYALFLLALQFLTRFPVDTNQVYSQARASRAIRYYPAVGVLVGGLAAVIYVVVMMGFDHPSLAAILSTAATVLVTGAFHEDGLADTCDGIGGGLTRERSLEIMRDSRLGTYGTIALVLILAAKVAVLAALTLHQAVAALLAGHAVSRLSAVFTVASSCYARDHGIAKPVAEGIEPGGLLIAVATTALGVGFALFGIGLDLAATALLMGLVGVAIGHGVSRLAFERKLRGYTGDCLGAVQQCSELGWYLGVLFAWR
ncbi:MAG: adenosylcobinamide-GDP ribazoletransferase [Pseudomonadota bacterium]